MTSQYIDDFKWVSTQNMSNNRHFSPANIRKWVAEIVAPGRFSKRHPVKLSITFKRRFGHHIPVLVQEMVTGNREFLAGITRFARFASSVVSGLGGVLTEIHNDKTLRLTPLADVDVTEMFADLRSRKLRDDYRGMPKVKQDTLTSILQAVGNIALSSGNC